MSQYHELGYVPEAIFNFILLLGWAPDSTQELFSKDEAIAAFDASRLSKSPSFFDVKKLNWMNQQYLKAMDEATYWKFVKPFVQRIEATHLYDEATLLRLSLLFKDHLEYAEQIIALLSPLVVVNQPLTEETQVLMHAKTTKQLMHAVIEALNKDVSLSPDAIKPLLKSIQISTNIQGKDFFMPLRFALSGQLHGTELALLIPALGREETIKRLGKWL
jgi:nondiscriminating glutamyl-tRNA synthetase